LKEYRFEFGRNWHSFLATVDQSSITAAQTSLQENLELASLEGLHFLDIGCGSGLFSLAARRLGACVRAFDYDLESVATAEELKRRFAPDDPHWQIEQGSVLDAPWMERLGRFDIVYAWGVLHHTGNMVTAFENVADRVLPGGKLFLSIYNDQGVWSRVWLKVKRLYVGSPAPLRPVIVGVVWTVLRFKTFLKTAGMLVLGLGQARGPGISRGMSSWHDWVDWCGGYPFEVAKPEEVFAFFRRRGFVLEFMQTCGGGLGCNQFVLSRELDLPPSLKGHEQP
jgi:2-polyprenyl-6-hydroxyphenyl methylase/3-demethylubiquinone-9 3-methyltransferase